MACIRPAVFAGRFYPSEPEVLRAQVASLLAVATELPECRPGRVKALIVPHAGYAYSGPVAASGYACLRDQADAIERVVLLGTAHTAVEGLASTRVETFATPLGTVAVDAAARAKAEGWPQVRRNERAHEVDHALEVQIPFLQVALNGLRLVPLLVGHSTPEQVAEVLLDLWGGPETLFVVSSDLSHYHDAETARRLDTATARAVGQRDETRIGPDQACGYRAIGGLIHAARERGLKPRTVDLRHSGDTKGPRTEVVGYGAFAFEEPAPRVM